MKKLCVTLSLLTLVGFVRAQNFEWAKKFGGTGYSVACTVNSDSFGNIYIGGGFKGTVDFDPSPGIYNLTTSSDTSGFVIKLDSNGTLIWAIPQYSFKIVGHLKLDGNGSCYLTGRGSNGIVAGRIHTSTGMPFWINYYGGAAPSQGQTINLDGHGNVYITGFFYGTFNGQNAYQSGGNVCIFKVDSLGNVIWTRIFTGQNNCYAVSAVDEAGNIYSKIESTVGCCSIDLDLGPGTYNMVNASAHLLKLDSSGNFVWAKWIVKGYGGGYIIATATGYTYVVGGFSFSQPVDFDPGPGVFNLDSYGSPDVYVTKFSPSGNFIWAKQIGGIGASVNATYIFADAGENLYLSTSLWGQADFDPGNSTFYIADTGVVVTKLDAGGNFIWAKQISEGTAVAYENNVDLDGNVYNVGAFSGISDFNPGATNYNLTATGAYDAFIHKMEQNICSTMGIVADSVVHLNCTNSSGFISVHTIHGTPPYSYTWANIMPPVVDSFITTSSGGFFHVNVTDANNCTRSNIVWLDAPNQPTGFDLNANFISGVFRPGQVNQTIIDAHNGGCLPINGSLKLVLDNLVSFNSANPAPNQVSGDTLIWNFSNLIFDSPHFTPTISVTTSTAANIGDTVCFTSIITPINGDANAGNNIQTHCYAVVNSYDPNVKEVYPKGACTEGFVLPNTTHTYTVQFQNTGTAAALDIYIIDSLDSDLYLNSLKVIASSHEMITEVLPGNVLRFSFYDINLPDSNSNEPASHGYLVYELHDNAGIPSGTVITNRADIYFDTNIPVRTNTVKNTVVNVIPVCPTSVSNVLPGHPLSLYPNPANNTVNIVFDRPVKNAGLKLLNTIGQKLLEHDGLNGNNFKMDISKLPPGIYIVELNEGENLYRARLIKE